MEVILFPHTHWDREWYKPFQNFRIRLSEVLDVLIEELEKNNIKYFYLDGQTIILEDYLEIHPEKAYQIETLIKNKRLFIGPWYVLADEFLVSGESLIRNLLIGINQAKKYGSSDFFGYLPDSFGHNSKIPEIMSSFGIKNVVLWRGAGNRKSEFLWMSDDDSSVLATYLTEGYFQDILHSNCPIEKKAEKIKEVLDKIRSRSISDKILLPVGGDHLAPVINLKEMIAGLNQKLPGYKLKQGTINEYFSSLNLTEKNLEKVKCELRDNSRNPILPGTLSSRLYLKQLNAVSTWKLSRIAEPLQSFLESAELVKSRKNELDYAWKLLLKNHPHDSICGCSADDVHEENVSRFKQVNQISDAIIDRCINDIVNMFSEEDLIVCNLSNYNFSGVVSVKTSKKLPESMPCQFVRSDMEFPKEILLDTQRVPLCEDMKEFREYLFYVEDILSFSLKSMPLSPNYFPVKVTENKINNSFIEISVNPDGTINLKDIKNNRIFKNLHIITDRADLGDTYNYSPFVGDKPRKAQFIKAEIAEKGHLRGKLKVFYSLKIPKYFDYETNSRSSERHETLITTEITVTAGSNRAEFVTAWENICENHIMQLKFNLPENITETVSENTFGLIKRNFNPDYRLEDHIPAAKEQELRTNSAPMQRFVYSQGLGIITEGLSEYVVSGNSLYITILRATGKLSEIFLNTRSFPAGPPLNTQGALCFGKQIVKYALCPIEFPENGNEFSKEKQSSSFNTPASQLFKEADEFMGSINAFFGRGFEEKTILFPQNFLKSSNKNILAYAVKIPENKKINGIIIRLLNISDKPQTVYFSSDIKYSCFKEVNSLEEQVSEKFSMKTEIIFRPKELKSLLLIV